MTETIDPVQRINDLRQKVVAGEEITIEESQEAIALLRANRGMGANAKASDKPLPVDLNDLFKEKPNGKEKTP